MPGVAGPCAVWKIKSDFQKSNGKFVFLQNFLFLFLSEWHGENPAFPIKWNNLDEKKCSEWHVENPAFPMLFTEKTWQSEMMKYYYLLSKWMWGKGKNQQGPGNHPGKGDRAFCSARSGTELPSSQYILQKYVWCWRHRGTPPAGTLRLIKILPYFGPMSQQKFCMKVFQHYETIQTKKKKVFL